VTLYKVLSRGVHGSKNVITVFFQTENFFINNFFSLTKKITINFFSKDIQYEIDGRYKNF